MKKIIRLTESDLTRIVKRAINENISDRKGDLYSSINNLIDTEFEDMDPSEIADVLNNIMGHHKGKDYRRKNNIKDISVSDVKKHWSKNR